MGCNWCRQIDVLCRLMRVKPSNADYAIKLEKIILRLLQGKALKTFKSKQEATNPTWAAAGLTNKVIKHTLNDMALEIFPSKHSFKRQMFYMNYHLFMGDGITVKSFKNRITWMNQSLKYLPLIKMRNDQYRDCAPLGVGSLKMFLPIPYNRYS